MIEMVFEDAMKRACLVLQETQAALRDLECPVPSAELKLNLKNLGTKSKRTLLNKLPTGKVDEDLKVDYVYVIGLIRPAASDYSNLRDAFATARAKNATLAEKTAFCRSIDEHTAPNAIYVGRSKKLRTRIAQHLDDKTGRTYAMHMGQWATELDLELSISFITFENKTDSLVQAVEDGLWVALKPALGKQGAR